jgi:hypothetical protein
LNGKAADAVEEKRRNRVYDEATRQALIMLCKAADRVCGKRLKTLVPMLTDAMERHGHIDLDPIGAWAPSTPKPCKPFIRTNFTGILCHTAHRRAD